MSSSPALSKVENSGTHFEDKIALNLKNPWSPTQNTISSLPLQQPLPLGLASSCGSCSVKEAELVHLRGLCFHCLGENAALAVNAPAAGSPGA